MAGSKVILRADIENLGKLGDVVVVKPGFARNYLLPQGLAMVASPANLKVFELERKKLQTKMDALRSEASGIADRINAASVVIAMRVGDNDKLYGSVTSSMISASLAAQGIEVDRHRILLDSAIRSLGEYDIRVRLHAGISATVKVAVVPEERINHDSEPAGTEPAEEASVEESAAE